MKNYTVNFINQDISIKAVEGSSLAKICNEAGFLPDLVCGGKGTCGKCKIETEVNNEKTIVLACQTKIYSDLNIYLTDEDYNKKAQILDYSCNADYEFNPFLKKEYKDILTIRNECQHEFLPSCDINVLRTFSELINRDDCRGITFVLYNNEIIDVQPGDTTKFLYGAAVDIGTTTVVLYVYDLNNGALAGTYSSTNSQICFGADVVSRITYADSKEGLDELNGKIMFTLNNLVQRAEFEIPNLIKNLYNITLCGNSTMQHLFLELRPDSLGASPFTCITKSYVELFGKDTDLQCAGRCKIIFLPLLGGFVGADTTAVLLTISDDNKDRLIIDLGTNGEIAAGSINNYYAASTACGPALEGGFIDCGMRGAEGAVERVIIEGEDVHIKVIGNGEPIGICGSGIIDAVAELLRNNIIDNTGRILSYDEFEQIKPYSKLKDRLTEINGINSFVLYEGNKNIYINQKDIRQVQLAKSSIYTGCMTLINAIGKDIENIDEIIVAGAFGNYIDLHNAIYIGLLPNAYDKIKFIGNGAGKGAAMFLLDKSMTEKCNKIKKNSVHYELADNERFKDTFICNMDFIY